MAATIFILTRGKKTEGPPSSTPPVEFSDNRVVCPLDGTKVEQNDVKHPIAIMVENHTQARPQAGLDKASIVYEAVAEGGITRFMAMLVAPAPIRLDPFVPREHTLSTGRENIMLFTLTQEEHKTL